MLIKMSDQHKWWGNKIKSQLIEKVINQTCKILNSFFRIKRFSFCHSPVDFCSHSCAYPLSLLLTPALTDAPILTGKWQKPKILRHYLQFIWSKITGKYTGTVHTCQPLQISWETSAFSVSSIFSLTCWQVWYCWWDCITWHIERL